MVSFDTPDSVRYQSNLFIPGICFFCQLSKQWTKRTSTNTDTWCHVARVSLCHWSHCNFILWHEAQKRVTFRLSTLPFINAFQTNVV